MVNGLFRHLFKSLDKKSKLQMFSGNLYNGLISTLV